MKAITGGFLTIFGLGWTAILGLIYLVEYLSEGRSSFELPTALIFAAPGLVVLLVGLVLLGLGLISNRQYMARQAEKMDLAEHITAKGHSAMGKVTFVDKDYSVLVNEKPIYSSFEVLFEDHMGRPHITRKNNIDSDLVIRAQVVVGSQLEVRFLPSNPDENVVLIKEPDYGV